MKYKELNINEKLFGKDYLIYDWLESDEEIHIYIKSKSHTAACPDCRKVSSFFHATYVRKIQTVPMHLKTTYLHVTAYKYKCLNDACETKVIMETLNFASASQVRTTELTSLILAVSIFLSNEGASKVLSLIGVKVSNDTIKRIYDKIIIDDEPNVEAVGIDDVAIRKGQTYATAIYDLNDHHLIALLDGRDAETLKKWLKNHKKIKLIARDRASAYAKAINEILPECTQVADRFHLLQNLVQRIRDIFKDTLPKEIFIKNGQVLDDTPQQVNVLKIDPLSKALDVYSYNNDPPVNEDGLIIIYDNKSRNLDNSQYKRQSENRKIKQQLIHSIQSRWMKIEPQSIKFIADEFSISVLTAGKYIQMSEEDINLLDQPMNYKKRKTVADDYLNIIYKMLGDKIDPAVILAYTIKMGYAGNIKTMQSYIELFSKNNFNYKFHINWAYKKEFPEEITLIKRHQVLSYILRKDSEEIKINGLEKHIEAIKKRYDIVNVLKNAYYSFYTTLMGNAPAKLETFINDYESSPIKGFIEGIKKDIAPVKNAISHSESSGFVEGKQQQIQTYKTYFIW
ncbi:ISL3 family transposase [Clostridium gasigenes]|uniref:ISL3 family transposase n=1 Tax=Clostridium gasigenes TaxID=94869 RepID=UPI00209A8723|nr:ISL3 family transposase [Clostridium gasigenes]